MTKEQAIVNINNVYYRTNDIRNELRDLLNLKIKDIHLLYDVLTKINDKYLYNIDGQCIEVQEFLESYD